MNIYRFRENNELEGETWDFFFTATPEQQADLATIIEQNGLDEEHECTDKVYTRQEVDVLVENARNGYFDSHEYIGTLTKPLPTNPYPDSPHEAYGFYTQLFYKNGLANFTTEDNA